MGRLWIHELHRIYLDRLITEKDCDIYWSAVRDGFRSFEMNADVVFATPNIHTSFISASKGHEKHYVEITDMQELKDVLETKLAEYNENMSP